MSVPNSSPNVLGLRDGFEMARVHTTTVPAKMIKNQADRHWPLESLVKESMRQPGAMFRGAKFPVWAVKEPRTFPDPTTSVGIDQVVGQGVGCRLQAPICRSRATLPLIMLPAETFTKDTGNTLGDVHRTRHEPGCYSERGR